LASDPDLEPAVVTAGEVSCELSSFGPASSPRRRRGGEAIVQAMSGLMAVNGWDEGGPRRIGLEVASVAAGVLATQGVLAALVGHSRGRGTQHLRTSTLQAALLACSHYIAAATSGDEPAPGTAGREPAPGPPFVSGDGHWFEIETLDPEAWGLWWTRLGTPTEVLGRAWTRFRARYFLGTCTLPPGLHEATARHSLADLMALAASLEVSLTPVRGYGAVLSDLGDWRGMPPIDELPTVARGERPFPPADPFGPRSGLPLDGLVVVEVTTRMQGPLAGLLLQMLGARVVKVEPPGGDVGRMMAPLADDIGSFFSCFNRGKETMELDLTAASGRNRLLELVRGADVFIHNWRPGRSARWGFEPADLASIRPGLVYTEASGWGARPQLNHLVGTDFLVQAYAGLGDGLRPAPEPSRPSRVLLSDFMGALVTCEGALAGLYRRSTDGRGRRVGTSLLAGAVTLEAHVLDGLRTGAERGRRAGRPVWTALDRPVQTGDGALMVSVHGDDELARAARACGMGGEGPREAIERRVAEHLAAGRAADGCDLLVDAGVACAVVSTDLGRLPSDPALASLFEPLGTRCWAPGSPWRFEE
jgi:crotonobetainyl-CoA:carnitine CoA-transferase CaiB-like acyl-CoA transferase